jgi:DNA-binding IclR family transcriptional regulator
MNARTLSPHVLRALALAQIEGRAANLETLIEALGVRRGDLRRTVTLLHRQGFVDVLRMRLTLAGFALGRAYLSIELGELRAVATGSPAGVPQTPPAVPVTLRAVAAA